MSLRITTTTLELLPSSFFFSIFTGKKANVAPTQQHQRKGQKQGQQRFNFFSGQTDDGYKGAPHIAAGE